MRLRRQDVEDHGTSGEDIDRPSRFRPVDLVHLARQTMGDRALEREVLGLMSQQLAHCAARIGLATDAERSAIAHAVGGAAKNIGAFALAQQALRLESRPGCDAARGAMLDEIERVQGFIGTLLR